MRNYMCENHGVQDCPVCVGFYANYEDNLAQDDDKLEPAERIAPIVIEGELLYYDEDYWIKEIGQAHLSSINSIISKFDGKQVRIIIEVKA